LWEFDRLIFFKKQKKKQAKKKRKTIWKLVGAKMQGWTQTDIFLTIIFGY